MTALAAKNSHKGLAKTLIEYGVDDRIDGARDVAEPEKYGSQPRRHGAECTAEADDEIGDEEWRPTDEEADEDDREHSGRFVLVRQLLTCCLQENVFPQEA